MSHIEEPFVPVPGPEIPLARRLVRTPSPIKGVFGVRTGSVFIRDFDAGIFDSLGAFPDPKARLDQPRKVIEIAGGQFQIGFDIDRNKPIVTDFVPIVFATPENPMSRYTVPLIIVRRESIDPVTLRWTPESVEYQVPAEVHRRLEVTLPDGQKLQGVDRVETKARAWPVDIVYTIEILARLRNDANTILRRVLKTFQVYGNILVKDSLGEKRTYQALMEGVTDITDLLDVVGRIVGFSVSIRIIGELDLNDPENKKTVEQIRPRIKEPETKDC